MDQLLLEVWARVFEPDSCDVLDADQEGRAQEMAKFMTDQSLFSKL